MTLWLCLQVVDRPLMAWAAVGIVVAGYFHYVVSVIGQICAYLGINCLTIPTAPDKGVKAH